MSHDVSLSPELVRGVMAKSSGTLAKPLPSGLAYNPDWGGPRPAAWSFDGVSDFIRVQKPLKGGEGKR